MILFQKNFRQPFSIRTIVGRIAPKKFLEPEEQGCGNARRVPRLLAARMDFRNDWRALYRTVYIRNIIESTHL